MRNNLCIIVPVYNDWEQIQKNLEVFRRIKKQFHSIVDVVFVDNGSNTLPALGSDYELDVCMKPGSYSARNYAITKRLQKYQYFLFTDADCIPTESWLPSILTEIEKNGGPLIAGSIELYTGSGNHTFVESYELILGIPQERYVNNGYAVTANLAIRADVFDSIGLFDDERFSGGDADFCRRAAGSGFNLSYLEAATILHPARSEWSEIVNKVKRVTGGQTGNGSIKSRVKYLVFNMLPPVRAYLFILKTDANVSLSDKIKAATVVSALWPVRMHASIKAFFLGPTVR